MSKLKLTKRDFALNAFLKPNTEIDFNRHLEEIVEKTDVLFGAVCGKFLTFQSCPLEKISKLSASWEAFKEIEYQESANSGILSTRVKLFQSRVSNLLNFINDLNAFVSTDDFAKQVGELRRNIIRLESEYSKAGNLNSGGKFEWIDSILVKCVKSGNWLLLENVNACSSAILDRLNELLEDEGCLHLGEKGVDENGMVEQVDKHPDFRLFLTMDPQRGDISRAMKNRCVEIQMKAVDWDCRKNHLDIMAIIRRNGITNYSVISTLLDVHEKIRLLNFGSNAISINNLTNVCFLMRERCKGVSLADKDCIFDCCLEVYATSRFLTREQKRLVTDTLKEAIDSASLNDRTVTPYYNCLNPAKLQIDSILHVTLYELGLLPYLSLNFGNEEEKKNAFVAHFVLLYLMYARRSDLYAREKWLQIFQDLWKNSALEIVPPRIGTILRKMFAENDAKGVRENDNFSPPLHILLLMEHLLVDLVKICPEIAESGIFNVSLRRFTSIGNDVSTIGRVDKAVAYFPEICEILASLIDDNKNAEMGKVLTVDVSGEITKFFLDAKRFREMGGLPFYSNRCKNHDTGIPARVILQLKWCLKSINRVRAHFLNHPEWSPILGEKYEKLVKISHETDLIYSPLVSMAKKVKVLMFGKNSNCTPLKRSEWILKKFSEYSSWAIIFEQKREMAEFEFSVDLLPIVEIYRVKLEGNERFGKLSSTEAIDPDYFIKHWERVMSSAFFPYRKFLSSEAMVEYTNEGDILPITYPSLFHYCVTFLTKNYVPNELPSAVVPKINGYVNHRQTISQLRELLWNNCCSLLLFQNNSLTESRRAIQQYSYVCNHLCTVTGCSDVKELKDKWSSELKRRCGLEVMPPVSNSFLRRFFDELSRADDFNNLHTDDENERWLGIGFSYLHVGMALFMLFAFLDVMDPSKKKMLKLQSFQQNRFYVETRLFLLKKQEEILGYSISNPYAKLFGNLLMEMQGKLNKYEGASTVETRQSYQELYKFVESSIRTFSGMFESLEKNKLQSVVEFRNRKFNFKGNILIDLPHLKSAFQSFVRSVEQFLETLKKNFSDLRQVTAPITYGATLLNYGASICCSALEKIICHGKTSEKDVTSVLATLMAFPNNLIHYQTLMENLDRAVALTAARNPNGVLIKLVKSCLREIQTVLAATSDFSAREIAWDAGKQLFNKVVALWEMQEKMIAEKREASDSLYVFKARTVCENVPEEEATADEIKQFFSPSYERDFGEVSTSAAENDPKEFVVYLEEEEMSEIRDLHENLANGVSCPWMDTEFIPPDVRERQLLTVMESAFEDRIPVIQGILLRHYRVLHANLDAYSMQAILMMTNLDGRKEDIHRDFYHNADPEEAGKFTPILKDVRNRTAQLLTNWEENPTLISILQVLDRIEGFECNSPISRFLTGADVLFKKLHEWEMVAHSGVSMSQQFSDLTTLIIRWRKIEISYWENALSNITYRIKRQTGKWWFHAYSICWQYYEIKSGLTQEEFVKTLQKFIETSSVGEFECKLKLLIVFHRYYLKMPEIPSRRDLLRNLWNLHAYYSQFSDKVAKYTADSTALVMKNLKDFVKISRFNDANYWAVIKSVEKTQQTLFKHYKQYEKLLQSPVTLAMRGTLKSLFPVWKSNREELSTSPMVFVECRWLRKCSKLCSKITKSAASTHRLEALTYVAEYAEEIVAGVEELNGVEIVTGGPVEKRRSQAKSLLQRKRKAFSDMFKELTDLGLSFKAGLKSEERFSLDFCLLAPIDAEVAFAEFPDVSPLVEAWKGCESSFLACVANEAVLKARMEKPHKDLAPEMLDRVKGFIRALMTISFNCKAKVAEAVERLYALKWIKVIMEAAWGGKLMSKNKIVDKAIDESVFKLRQFAVIFNKCPEQDSSLMEPVVGLKNETKIVKNSAQWKRAKFNVESVIETVKKAQEARRCELFGGGCDWYIKSQNAVDLNRAADVLKGMWAEVSNDPEPHPFCRIVAEVEVAIRALPEMIEAEECVTFQVDASVAQVLQNKIMKVVEVFFKRYEGNKYQTTSKLLKDVILVSLDQDWNDLKIEKIQSLCESILKSDGKFREFIRGGNGDLRLVWNFLDQYCNLLEFVTCDGMRCLKACSHLCSNLQQIFAEFCAKGYNVPEDLLVEQEEGEDKKENGMGMEDGDGVKDVSDQIESQDQLEGAKEAGVEEVEAQDCKEEENGIEMSEDFGGKSQELEKKEDHGDSSEVDEEEDLDKEMGHTGEEAETLDEEVWADSEEGDEDEEEESLPKDKEEKGGKGGGEKELAAKKEGVEDEGDDEENSDNNRKEQHKDEINEMDEGEKDDDHIDPYHGNHEPLPEPEGLDLPDNLQLDEGDEGKDEDMNDENPFDIDEMKEKLLPPEESAVEDNAEGGDKKDKNDAEDEVEEDDDDVGLNKGDEKLEENDHESMDVDEKTEDGGSKDEDKTGEERKEEGMEVNEDVKPSEDKAYDAEIAEADDRSKGSNDTVCQDERNDKSEDGKRENKEDSCGMEEQGVGTADQNESEKEGHSSNLNKGAADREEGASQQKRKIKAGESDDRRALAPNVEPLQKRLKTLDKERPEDDLENEVESEKKEAEVYQHVKEPESGIMETLDAATKEQAEKQVIPEEKEQEDTEGTGGDDFLKEEEELAAEMEKEGEKKLWDGNLGFGREKSRQNDKETENPADCENADSMEVDVEGDAVETSTVMRGLDTTYYTSDLDFQRQILTAECTEWLKRKSEEELIPHIQACSLSEATIAWDTLTKITCGLSQELSEQLRLVLEPTQASRLKGDFRTGRRVNMRKVIPYIASEFKKDKIWLRRTKPCKREYQIILSIDNSVSMSDNHSKEMAFESLAMLSKALTLIEAGELGVISFGEKARILHTIGQPFTPDVGARLIRDFTFEETKTGVAEAVSAATGIFLERGSTSRGTKLAQLLILISDGRGVNSGGAENVQTAIRNARQAGIFVVFIIVDNPDNKESILDIQKVVMEGLKFVGIESYIDSFPFPFYLILRDINKLPTVLSDALRQWFELIANSEY